MTMPPMMVSVVSPVYGCTGCLHEIVRRTRTAFDDRGIAWELVFVDDRGPDDPWSVITKLAAQDERVHGVRLMRNHGQHLAIWAGLAHARGDWVAVIDCDLQDDPSIIPNLYDRALATGTDAVIVDRGTWSDKWWRRATSRAFYAVVKRISGFRMDTNAGNFGIYSQRMVRTLLSFRDKEVFLPAMTVMTGLPRQTYVVQRSARFEGQSSYNLSRLLRFASALIVRFSDRPLKISVVVGMMLSGLSALFAVVLVAARILGVVEIAGWTSIVLSIWFIGGLILFVLGIHGFYIGRIFAEVQHRPRIRVEQLTANTKALAHDPI